MIDTASNVPKTVTLPPRSRTRLGPGAIRGRQALPAFVPWLVVALLCCTPAAALGDNPYAVAPYPMSQHRPVRPRPPIGTFFHVCLLIGGVAATVSSNIIGPVMGISSVLWLMMRNDSAVDPRFSWMVFGAWFFFAISYFMLQCRRVYNHRLYIFLSITLACICMCAVALLQRSSLESGLVTVIPPCTSFAAYTVAYFFPDWAGEKMELNV